jgi:hypothetical protein
MAQASPPRASEVRRARPAVLLCSLKKAANLSAFAYERNGAPSPPTRQRLRAGAATRSSWLKNLFGGRVQPPFLRSATTCFYEARICAPHAGRLSDLASSAGLFRMSAHAKRILMLPPAFKEQRIQAANRLNFSGRLQRLLPLFSVAAEREGAVEWRGCRG